MNVAANIAERLMTSPPTETPSEACHEPGAYMRALVWHGDKDVRIETVPKPAITDPRDAIVKVTATTICGSDLHLYHKEIAEMRQGDILGHEAVGVVELVGEAVKFIQPGQRVAISAVIACGQCAYCQREEFSGCDGTNPSAVMERMYGHRTPALFGYSHLTVTFTSTSSS